MAQTIGPGAKAPDFTLPGIRWNGETMFGVTAPGVGVRRSVFLVGPDGRVRWRHIALLGIRRQPVERLTAELSRIGA
ncbi:hypothetical protein AB0I81_25630 [Nonomuraea sp. NPDC050404]|uniref:hypothetical protein n=1 Tax=Nonomuraea sp. NPDC050404 TaxID=3155783 RepID=UPI0033C5FA9D